MRLKGTLSDLPLVGKVLIILGICLLSVSIFGGVAYVLAMVFFKINLAEPGLLENHIKNQNVINSFKVMQGLSAIGLFVVPPIISAFLFSSKPSEYLGTKRKPELVSILIITMLLIAITPLINYVYALNQHLNLPDALQWLENWMKDYEEKGALFQELFLSTKSINGLLFNVLVIALIPAIGEELLFRGLIQQMLHKATGKIHLAVILSAAFFSAFHMQFYGFVPRMLLGIVLGYAFAWSSSLWLPIFGHFFNNAMAVILAFLVHKKGLSFNQDTIGTEEGEIWLTAVSLVFSIACMYSLYKMRVKRLNEGVLSE
jgi:uncharacterized protein